VELTCEQAHNEIDFSKACYDQKNQHQLFAESGSERKTQGPIVDSKLELAEQLFRKFDQNKDG